VLAYDYVERLSAISTRETKLQEQMQEQKIRVEKLKLVSQEQAEVITNQKLLIENLKKGLWQRHEAWDRVCSLKETERQRLIKLCNDELPVVGHSL
jgi:signal transduction histidine kinase